MSRNELICYKLSSLLLYELLYRSALPVVGIDAKADCFADYSLSLSLRDSDVKSSEPFDEETSESLK